jgi:hypothetical protein
MWWPVRKFGTGTGTGTGTVDRPGAPLWWFALVLRRKASLVSRVPGAHGETAPHWCNMAS